MAVDERDDHVAEQQAPAERIAAGRRDRDDQGDRAPHLDRARDPDELAQPAKVAERELEAHGEQKEDDAEVGEDLHDFHVGEEAEPERPEQRSRQQKPDEGRLPQPMHQKRGAQRREKDQRQGPEKFRRLHASPLCPPRVLW